MNNSYKFSPKSNISKFNQILGKNINIYNIK
jgi:hypothetical protein